MLSLKQREHSDLLILALMDMVDGHEERDFNIYYNFIGHIDL